MTTEEIRRKIADLITEKQLSMAKVSLGIGKNVAYLQQFITKGSPLRLPEEQRKKLALILGVDEQELTDLPLTSPIPAHMAGVAAVAEKITSWLTPKEDIATIEMVDVTACCGEGIDNLSEKVCGHWNLPLVDFKSIVTGSPNNIKMLRVQGDSMTPTIADGDFVWVDISNNFVSSDGIYLIKTHTGISVKRVQSGLSNITIICDNPIYKNEITTMGEIQIIGRVVHILNSRRA